MRPRTYIFDIDGCLLEHVGSLVECLRAAPKALPGAVELLSRLQSEGHHIVIMTGRPQTTKRRTEDQLSYAGLIYHQLVMGVTGGVRVLINDNSGPEQRAYAIPMHRNSNVNVYVQKWEHMQEAIANGPGWTGSCATGVTADKCPEGLLPDGPVCPRCSGTRAPSGIDGGTWVHFTKKDKS